MVNEGINDKVGLKIVLQATRQESGREKIVLQRS